MKESLGVSLKTWKQSKKIKLAKRLFLYAFVLPYSLLLYSVQIWEYLSFKKELPSFPKDYLLQALWGTTQLLVMIFLISYLICFCLLPLAIWLFSKKVEGSSFPYLGSEGTNTQEKMQVDEKEK